MPKGLCRASQLHSRINLLRLRGLVFLEACNIARQKAFRRVSGLRFTLRAFRTPGLE